MTLLASIIIALLVVGIIAVLVAFESVHQRANDYQKLVAESEKRLAIARNELFPLVKEQPKSNFDFPVNVPDLDRESQIHIATFLQGVYGKLLFLRLRATLCNMAIAAGSNKQYAGNRASEAHGYNECLMQLQSLSVVPTASDIPASGQLDEAGALLNKLSP